MEERVGREGVQLSHAVLSQLLRDFFPGVHDNARRLGGQGSFDLVESL